MAFAGPSEAGARTVGMYHLAWEVPTLEELASMRDRLRDAGAIRADVSGAGPCVYGLFADAMVARRAELELQSVGRTWLTSPR